METLPITGLTMSVALQPNPAITGETMLATVDLRLVTSFYYTLPATAWEGNGPYEMTLAVDESIVPDSDCIVYADHSNSLTQRVSEYNAVLRAEITAQGRVTFRALGMRPRENIGVRIINGIFPTMVPVTVPVSWWTGTGPWYANVNVGSSVQSAAVAAVSGSTDAEAEGVTDSGIHVSGVSGQVVTLRAMMAKPISQVMVGVMGI